MKDDALEVALKWADHKKAAIVPAHVLAAAVRSLQARLAETDKEMRTWREQEGAQAKDAADLRAKLSTAKEEGRRWQDKFDHLNHAVYEAYTQSVISAPTQEKLCKAQSWEPEAQAKGGAL